MMVSERRFYFSKVKFGGGESRGSDGNVEGETRRHKSGQPLQLGLLALALGSMGIHRLVRHKSRLCSAA